MKKIFLFVACLLFAANAQVRITELLEFERLDSADVIPFVDVSADTTKKILYFDFVSDRLNSLAAISDSLNDLRLAFDAVLDSVTKLGEYVYLPNFRVIINDFVSAGLHAEEVKTSFIAGYESAGGTWSDSIQIQYDVSIEYSFQSADSNLASLIIRSTTGLPFYINLAASYYPTYLFFAAGSNDYERVFDAGGSLPALIATGAGADTNITGYDIEFHGIDPLYGNLSSFSNGYIAGQLLYIADYLDVDLWTARYLARQTGNSWTNAQGYGKINIAACIAAYDSEINYKSLDQYR